MGQLAAILAVIKKGTGIYRDIKGNPADRSYQFGGNPWLGTQQFDYEEMSQPEDNSQQMLAAAHARAMEELAQTGRMPDWYRQLMSALQGGGGGTTGSGPI